MKRLQTTNCIRVTGIAQAFVCVIVGVLVCRSLSRILGYVVLSWAAIMFLAALLSPRGALRIVEKMAISLGRMISLFLVWILFTTIYLVLLTPVAFFRRVCGQDGMARALDPKAASYWQAHDKIKPGLDHYKTQF